MIYSIQRELCEIGKLVLLALLRRGQKVIVFDLPSIGELQFIKPVLLEFLKRHPEDMVLVNHHGSTKKEFDDELTTLHNRLTHVQNKYFRLFTFPKPNIFLTTEQSLLGIDGVYSIAIFHGHPSKGLTFSPKIIQSFDAFFFYGPLHRQAFEEYIESEAKSKPEYLDLFNIGYPKSDDLLNNAYSSKDIIKKLSLSQDKKTVLYAPSFNEGCSLRENGIEIIELLAKLQQYNIIVKLPIDCWQPTSNFYATGGMSWFEEIQRIEVKYDNLHFYKEYQIDPVLACSDVMITCVSSVAFEFLSLNKPVIYIDTPKFFNGYLKKQFPHELASKWFNRSTINGGREFGLVVSSIDQLPQAIETVLSDLTQYPKQQEKLKSYLLYNRGTGTQAAVDKIEELLNRNVKSRRPYQKKRILNIILSSLLRKFLKILKRIINHCLNYYGYHIQKIGLGYIKAEETIRAANKTGLSICEYLENRESDERKRGRRDRIIREMEKRKLFSGTKNIVEIGAGTGMFLEKTIKKTDIKLYEVYETDNAWKNYLRETFGKDMSFRLICRPTDGETLRWTSSASFQLVHAHAVFVYLPILNTLSYIREAARVLANGGYLLFDVFLDSHFNHGDIKTWLDGPWRFPTVISESLLMEFTKKYSLIKIDQFSEIYGSGSVEYMIFKKMA
ncbi:MAG: CDP-glycerol glycerophosphotransferase family protein [Desulfobacterales bacterium]|nr:CDP-glycerol glycerophosphotransferase family protein [Desulfobacterales bacterium]MBF0398249.1 CDP-glycerol glycerophosphotransferase family protein [Desulfobacterales bacterium]